MLVHLDEQIFTMQRYGGISRTFASLASELVARPFGIEFEPLHAPIINEYVLSDQQLSAALAVRRARSTAASLGRFLTRRVPESRADVVHNTFYLPHGLNRGSRAPRVVTIHDMIPELFPRTRRRLDFITEKHRYVMAADHIVCVSEHTARDLRRTYPDVKAPISVIHHGVSAHFSPSTPRLPELPEAFIVHVGNRQHYKDGQTLLEAFGIIAKRNADVTLLLVGGGELTRREHHVIRQLGMEGRVIQRSMGDTAMASAYANALAMVFPSRYEGFGLPALEAMASGCPVVLAETSSLPEVGGTAAQYFPPGDSRRLAEVLIDLLDDPASRADMAAAGLARSRMFTWQACAQAHAHIYRTLAE